MGSPSRSVTRRIQKDQNGDLSSPQLWLPSHLSSWPTANVPTPPSPAEEIKSATDSRGADEPDAGKIQDAKLSLNKDQASKQVNTNVASNKKMKFSLSEDESDDSTSTGSSRSSEYESAGEISSTAKRAGFTRMDELSSGSGSDCELSDDGFGDRASGSQPTLDDSANERKHLLKVATVSQKVNKNLGKRRNKEKGGSENVFNARSPAKEASIARVRVDADGLSQANNGIERKSSPVTDFLDTLSAEMFGPKPSAQDALSSPAPANLHADFDDHAPHEDVSVRTRHQEYGNRYSTASQTIGMSQVPHGNSAALTEAQRQQSLLQRSGHREFSSRAFEVSDEGQAGTKSAEGPSSKVKTTRKRKEAKYTPSTFNPVEAEIAKQQARLRAHTAKKMREKPERHVVPEGKEIYELSSGDTSESDSGDRGASPAKVLSKSLRYTKLTAPSSSYHNEAPHRAALRKDKESRKRKHNYNTVEAEERDQKKRKQKAPKHAINVDEHNQTRESHIKELKGFLRTLCGILADEMQMNIPAARRVILQEIGRTIQDMYPDDPLPHLDWHKAKHDAELSAVLKSLWPLLPKALLHATMRNLNNANRIEMEKKLKLCLSGRQTDPNIRVVKLIDRHGDEVNLVQEFGIVKLPDPHTMSSDLTLLTAAKSLIILLSGHRTGLDMSAIVESAIHGKNELIAASGFKENKKGSELAGFSPMEEELRRIANERQQEIEQLKEQNRLLFNKLNRSKR